MYHSAQRYVPAQRAPAPYQDRQLEPVPTMMNFQVKGLAISGASSDWPVQTGLLARTPPLADRRHVDNPPLQPNLYAATNQVGGPSPVQSISSFGDYGANVISPSLCMMNEVYTHLLYATQEVHFENQRIMDRPAVPTTPAPGVAGRIEPDSVIEAEQPVIAFLGLLSLAVC